ncbi:Prospero homeobox protein 2 [Merluccius polli]|uniref:Prospero homeobox protein 2 n=1 Tax=Merluccius polli TaxID=89951 RepID=A0AA47N055_MERPO|nr:Prospero homeobox protein 2 [Merluccius polli]
MHASSNTYVERRSPEHLRLLKHDSRSLCTITDGLDIAVLLNKDEIRSSPLGGPYSTGSSRTELDGADPTPQDLNTLDLLSGPPPLLSPTAVPCRPTDWPLRNIRQAKRARVENIIRDMAGSSFSSSHEHFTEDVQEDKREWSQDGIQAQRGGRSGVVGCTTSEDLAIKNQLQNFKYQPVRKFRLLGGLPQEEWARDSDETKEETPLEETCSFGSDSTSKDHNDPNCSGGFEIPLGRKACGRKKVRVTTAANPPKRKPDLVNALMADILKYELSRAVSVSVDSIFKSMPLLEPPPRRHGEEHLGRRSLSVPLFSVRHPGRPQARRTSLRSPQARSNAPSLLRPSPHHHPKPGFSCHCTELRSGDRASKGLEGGAVDQVRCLKKTWEFAGGALKQETLGASGNSGSKVRCKVNSRLARGSQTSRHFAVDPAFLESLCGPLDVKAQSDGPQSTLMSNLFSLNDGLTTSHLKKAKLMFFYTRYPSSLVLKTFFYDVQFTRCITSQLIKWFSNFREFYYIQMEKQARQAVAEGVPHARALTVGRESELFRALNMHYNKASDFQVPERFLEVAEVTLREFYVAVSLGRDSDPSWKKPIYKVICKLDSNVPEEFKTQYPD